MVFDEIGDVMMVNDGNYPKQGLIYTVIRFAKRPQSATIEDEFEQYRSVVDQLKQQGWRQYIFPVDVRVFGRDSYSLRENTGLGSLDGYYLNDVEKWKMYDHFGSLAWFFYKGSQQIMLSKMLSVGSGYNDQIFRMTISTEFNDFYMSYSEDDRATRWAEVFAVDKIKWQRQREEDEVKAKALGYAIDEAYVDQPLPTGFELN